MAGIASRGKVQTQTANREPGCTTPELSEYVTGSSTIFLSKSFVWRSTCGGVLRPEKRAQRACTML